MTKMTMAQIKETAKALAFAQIEEALKVAGAEMYGAYKYAIPTEVDGQEVWVKVDLTSAQYTDTKVAEAFDPFARREEYEAELEIKASEKKLKAEAKSKKIAKDKKKREEKVEASEEV